MWKYLKCYRNTSLILSSTTGSSVRLQPASVSSADASRAERVWERSTNPPQPLRTDRSPQELQFVQIVTSRSPPEQPQSHELYTRPDEGKLIRRVKKAAALICAHRCCSSLTFIIILPFQFLPEISKPVVSIFLSQGPLFLYKTPTEHHLLKILKKRNSMLCVDNKQSFFSKCPEKESDKLKKMYDLFYIPSYSV